MRAVGQKMNHLCEQDGIVAAKKGEVSLHHVALSVVNRTVARSKRD